MPRGGHGTPVTPRGEPDPVFLTDTTQAPGQRAEGRGPETVLTELVWVSPPSGAGLALGSVGAISRSLSGNWE